MSYKKNSLYQKIIIYATDILVTMVIPSMMIIGLFLLFFNKTSTPFNSVISNIYNRQKGNIIIEKRVLHACVEKTFVLTPAKMANCSICFLPYLSTHFTFSLFSVLFHLSQQVQAFLPKIFPSLHRSENDNWKKIPPFTFILL